jgi:hypothetical protein
VIICFPTITHNLLNSFPILKHPKIPIIVDKGILYLIFRGWVIKLEPKVFIVLEVCLEGLYFNVEKII